MSDTLVYYCFGDECPVRHVTVGTFAHPQASGHQPRAMRCPQCGLRLVLVGEAPDDVEHLSLDWAE